MHDPTAVAAGSEDYERLVASLVAAFICDPFIRWMFPDARQYLHYFPLVLKYFAGRAFEHVSAYRSSDFRAAAMWLPPGVGPDEEALGRNRRRASQSRKGLRLCAPEARPRGLRSRPCRGLSRSHESREHSPVPTLRLRSRRRNPVGELAGHQSHVSCRTVVPIIWSSR